MPNAFPHLYQLDEPISNFGLLGPIFHFYLHFDGTFCKQTVEMLIRRPLCAVSDLGLHCLSMSNKRDTRLRFNLVVSMYFLSKWKTSWILIR